RPPPSVGSARPRAAVASALAPTSGAICIQNTGRAERIRPSGGTLMGGCIHWRGFITSEGGTTRASDRAYRALRDDIIDWALPPGTVLGEVEQADRIGVSRTPLREALSRLVADGLVAPQAGRGLVVTDVSVDNIRELFEVRRALEEQAARLAARRADASTFAALEAEFLAAPTL